jgi:hypothetical protein
MGTARKRQRKKKKKKKKKKKEKKIIHRKQWKQRLPQPRLKSAVPSS